MIVRVSRVLQVRGRGELDSFSELRKAFLWEIEDGFSPKKVVKSKYYKSSYLNLNPTT